MSSDSGSLVPWKRKSVHYSAIQLGKDVKAQTKAISEQTEALVAVQIASANEIISSQERIEEGIDKVAYEIGRVEEGISGLKAAFEWGISEVVWQIEQNRHVLQGILQVLMAPLDTQAKELRRRAEDAYANGWFKEALEDFLESEKKNKYDFLVHISIGMIYLFQEIDKENALEYFDKAIKYAKPKSPYHASYALLYKALIKRDFGLIEEAERCTDEAVKLCTDFAEALYQNAQYNALLNKPDKAIPLLRKAIELDINYCEKIHNEKDFGKIRTSINELFVELRDDQKQISIDRYSVLTKRYDAFHNLINELRNQEAIEIHDEEIKNCIVRITELIQRNSYRDYLEANTLLDKLSIMIQKSCDDTKILLEKSIGYYNSNIGNIKHRVEQRTDKRLENIKYVWLGIPISFILGVPGCIRCNNMRVDYFNGIDFLLSLGPPFFGSIITVITYFVLRSIFKSSGKGTTPEIISDESLIERLRDVLRRLERV